MAINTLQEKFVHGLEGVYDAEHQFLKGMEEMLQNASDPKLKEMITNHMDQTRHQISNLEQVFSTLGQQAKRDMCDGAKGIKETSGADRVQDCAIAGAADKVEHYEIATYRCLIQDAQLMGQPEVVSLLQQNLEQEQSTSQLIENSLPDLLRKAMGPSDMQGQYSQSYPTT